MKLLTIGAATALTLGIAAQAFAQGPSTRLHTVSGSQSGTTTGTSTASAGYAGAGGLNTTGGTISANSVSGGIAGAKAGPSGSTTYTLQGAQGSATGKNAFANGGANDIAGANYSHYTSKYTHSSYRAYEPYANIDP